jgi:hypothetical protein
MGRLTQRLALRHAALDDEVGCVEATNTKLIQSPVERNIVGDNNGQ